MSVIDLAFSPSDLRALAEQSNAWPFEQAKAIVARLKKSPKDEVLFETGYGPSGLPHIGTFGEVARTSMVRHAFRVLTEDKIKTRLLGVLRRHGRPAQGAGQRAEQGTAGAAISASR